jgi:hypothetical protein
LKIEDFWILDFGFLIEDFWILVGAPARALYRYNSRVKPLLA